MPGIASQIPTGKFQAIVAQCAAIRDTVVNYNEVLLAQVQQSAACNALHDTEERQQKDRLKERILALAGQTLYRIRRRSAEAGRADFAALLREIVATSEPSR